MMDKCKILFEEAKELYKRRFKSPWCAAAVARLRCDRGGGYSGHAWDLMPCYRAPDFFDPLAARGGLGVCWPVEPGPAAVALLRVAAAMGWRDALRLARMTIPDFVSVVYSKEGGAVRQAAALALYAADMARLIDKNAGTDRVARYTASTMYTIIRLTGLNADAYDAGTAYAFVYELRDRLGLRRERLLVEYCGRNIYAWTPVRRYRLPGSPAGVIDTLAKALREAAREA